MRKEWNKIEQTVTQETRSVSRRRCSKIFVPQLLSDLHSLLSEASMNRPSALPARHILSGGGGFYFTWPVPNLRQRDNKRRTTTKGRGGCRRHQAAAAARGAVGRDRKTCFLVSRRRSGRRRWGGGGVEEEESTKLVCEDRAGTEETGSCAGLSHQLQRKSCYFRRELLPQPPAVNSRQPLISDAASLRSGPRSNYQRVAGGDEWQEAPPGGGPKIFS